ncbi:MAG TPA: hypothetical protein PKA64_10395 [Myxococcota bacterium]|nr:hypothetical protein [Myxococcota bacterium]
MPEGEFITGYTQRLCKHTMACGDSAELTFDGILSQEDCEIEREAEVAGWGLGCKFRAGDAKTCLEDMDALTCPGAAGQLADIPTSCAAVYYDCQVIDTDAPATE